MFQVKCVLPKQKTKKYRVRLLYGYGHTPIRKVLRNLALLFFIYAGVATAQQTHVVTTLNDTGAGSLRDKITNSSDGDTITFSPALLANGSASINLSSFIDFNHGLTIKGLFTATDSLSISGMNTNRVFNVEASSNLIPTHVHLQDLIIKNGRHTSTDHLLHYTNGGAIYMAGLEKLSLENVIMRDNHAKGEASGGAMYLYDNDTVILKHCKFKNNTTDITNTSSGSGGGALYHRIGLLNVDSCEFLANNSKGHGGALYSAAGKLAITNSRFASNHALGPNQPTPNNFVGGALFISYMDSVFISQSTFFENRAKSDGGALSLSQSGATIYNSSFIKNEAQDHEGGAISCSPDYMNRKRIDIIGCTLDSNWAYSGGGALDLSNGNYLIKGCFIHNNLAATAGSGAINGVDSEILVLNSTFINNEGANDGSAFSLINGAKASIVNTTILGQSGKDIFNLTYADSLKFQSSIIVVSGGDIAPYSLRHKITSSGHNIFSGNGSSYKVSSDQVNISPQMINLKPPGLYGGTTLCQPPNPGSPAYNAGNPNDFSDAQNGPIFNVRDCGAAEAQVISTDTAYLCGPYQWWGNTYTKTGFYTDTAYNPHSLDSIGYLYLVGQDSLVTIQNGKLIAPQRDSNTTYQWVYCDSAYAAINGANDSVFMPIANGTYAVVMTQPGCQDTSDCIAYNQVGTPEYARQRPFVQFYPNPSTGKIQVESPDDNKAASLKVYNLQGRLLATIRIHGPEIDLRTLPAGVYLLEWHSEKGGLQMDRMVIE